LETGAWCVVETGTCESEQVAASLIYGQVKKSYRKRKLVRVTHVMRLGTEDADPRRLTRNGLLRPAEHRVYRAGQSDHSAWKSRVGSSNLGQVPTGSTAAGSPGVVAGLLPRMSRPVLRAASEAGATARTRWQASGTTLSAAYPSYGSRKDSSTMDDTGGTRLPLAASIRLRATEGGGCRVMSRLDG
jgi:hypothetical protein